MLNDIETMTGVDFFEDRYALESIASQVVFTGCIDEYFGYSRGRLQYRTVRFDQERLSIPNYQGCAVVNYTGDEVPYTRIIEHKHFEMFGHEVFSCPHTVISREFSVEWEPGMEPYYPVNSLLNESIAEEYRNMARAEHKVIFGGRLAEYRYYDMAPIVEQVFRLYASLS